MDNETRQEYFEEVQELLEELAELEEELAQTVNEMLDLGVTVQEIENHKWQAVVPTSMYTILENRKKKY